MADEDEDDMGMAMEQPESAQAATKDARTPAGGN
jgi:hypothetical protein